MQTIRIGRSSQNDVVINDEYVSGCHCQIIQDDGGNFVLIDTNSSNGTYVNGVLRRGEVSLNPTDTVRIGNTVLPWLDYFSNEDGAAFSAPKGKAGKKPQRKGRIATLLRYGLILTAFLVGLVLPSPFFRNEIKTRIENYATESVDTVNMVVEDGLYNGTISKNNHKRNGYGRYETKDGSVYEGEWKDGRLRFGTRTTAASVYTGHFDAKLNNDGFGVINYSESYIAEKSRQGLPDAEIVVTYIGNWRKNYKHGLGRAIKKDGSMDFGRYSEGILKAKKTNYTVGGNVYGIDVSHHQTDIDWDNLAFYCDEMGNVYNGKPKERTHLQPVFFVYVKATEGASVKDEMFNVRMIEAERHGIAKGAYHFLRLGTPVDEQIKNFLETATWNPGDLPPALDVELEAEVKKYGIEKMQSMVLEWLEKVEDKLGVRPIIYTSEGFRSKYFNNRKFNGYGFWVARYGKSPDKPDWKIWQKSQQGQISGCEGNVDINLYHGDYGSFRLYLQSVGGK